MIRWVLWKWILKGNLCGKGLLRSALKVRICEGVKELGLARGRSWTTTNKGLLGSHHEFWAWIGSSELSSLGARMRPLYSSTCQTLAPYYLQGEGNYCSWLSMAEGKPLEAAQWELCVHQHAQHQGHWCSLPEWGRSVHCTMASTAVSIWSPPFYKVKRFREGSIANLPLR